MNIPYIELFKVMDNQVIPKINNDFSVEHLNASFFEDLSSEKKYPGGKGANVTHIASNPKGFINGMNILTKPNEGCFVLAFLLNEKKPYIKGFNSNIPIELTRFLNIELDHDSVSDIINNKFEEVTLEQIFLLDFYGAMIAGRGSKQITTYGQTIANMLYSYSVLTNRQRSIRNGEVVIPNLLETIRNMHNSYTNFRTNNYDQFQFGNTWPEINDRLLIYKSLLAAFDHLNVFQKYSFQIGDIRIIMDQI